MSEPMMTTEEIAAATALCEKAPFAIGEFRRLVMEKLGVSGCLEATQLAELSTESAKALASLTEAYAEIEWLRAYNVPASLVAELIADAAQRYCPELERVEAEAYANSRWVHDKRLAEPRT